MTISRHMKKGLWIEFWTQGICFIQSGLLCSAPAQQTLNFLWIPPSKSRSQLHGNCLANITHHLPGPGWSCRSLQTKFSSHLRSQRNGRDWVSSPHKPSSIQSCRGWSLTSKSMFLLIRVRCACQTWSRKKDYKQCLCDM